MYWGGLSCRRGEEGGGSLGRILWMVSLHSFPPRFIYPGAGFTKWNTLSVESGGETLTRSAIPFPPSKPVCYSTVHTNHAVRPPEL